MLEEVDSLCLWSIVRGSTREQLEMYANRESQTIKMGRFQIATSCMEESRIPKDDRSLIVPNGRRTERRKIGHVPASSQCFDEEHTRVQPTSQDINGVSLVGELDRLRGDDLEVRVDPAFVTIRKKLKRFLR